jgi:GH24 family phage-related lysozyme (muramidase)
MGYKANEYKVSRKNPVEKSREEANLDHGIYVGEVIVRPKDESHSGRIPVYIPMLSKDRNDPRGYFNCFWSSPFAGTTPSAAVGKNNRSHADTMKTYGMWMVPPDPGNFVLVIFGDGKKKNPIIIGCMFPDQMQSMVPGNPAGKTFGTEVPVPVAEKNRFDPNKSHGKGVQRPFNPFIAIPIINQGLINDPVRGTTTSGARRESPSQVYGILTPGPENINLETGKRDGTNRLGGHSFVMDDNLKQRHIRMRTAGGGQVLIDDTNELVYVINSPGTAWVELSSDGSIQIFSDEDINMRSTNNINIRADQILNLDAGVRVNINAGLMEDQGEEVDPKLDGPIGGDVYIQSGNSINQLTNTAIKLETKKGGSVISTNSAGKTLLYGASGVESSTPMATVIKSGGDTFVTSGGSGHVVSGGQSFVKGSTVHLNDGGTNGTADSPAPVTPLAVNVFHDEPMSIPVVDYDATNVDTRNPLPGGGVRQTDPSLPASIPQGTESNFSDVRGKKIKVASTTTMITTREPWFGHKTADTRIQTSSNNDAVLADSFAAGQYPPGTSDYGRSGPDTIVNPDGTVELGVGYDGVSGPALQDYLTAKHNTNYPPGSPGLIDAGQIRSMVPDYKEAPMLKSDTLSGSALASQLEDTGGLQGCVDGITNATSPSLTETDMIDDAGNYPDKPITAIGYKHVIGDAEKQAGTIMFGDGKNFDPTSATTIIDTGKSKISAADISSIIKDAGPGQDLSSQGIFKASDVSDQFKVGDAAYAIIPEGGVYKEPIFINQTAAGMSKGASKQLLKNDLKQSALHAFNRAKSPMSVQQGMALTILTQRLGPSRFDETSVLKSIQAGQYDQIARNIRLTSESGERTLASNQGNALSRLWSSPDSMRPEILTIMQGGAYGGWDQVARELLLLHKAQKGF